MADRRTVLVILTAGTVLVLLFTVLLISRKPKEGYSSRSNRPLGTPSLVDIKDGCFAYARQMPTPKAQDSAWVSCQVTQACVRNCNTEDNYPGKDGGGIMPDDYPLPPAPGEDEGGIMPLPEDQNIPGGGGGGQRKPDILTSGGKRECLRNCEDRTIGYEPVPFASGRGRFRSHPIVSPYTGSRGKGPIPVPPMPIYD